MRRLAANYVFPVTQPPIKQGVIEIDDNGTIISVGSFANSKETEKTAFYNGILVPGFVNTHCHLELSALKKKISPHQGLPNFIASVQQIRKTISDSEYLNAIDTYDAYMYEQGIVAVGDICNTALTVETKKKSNIYYHSFIELFGLDASKSHSIITQGKELQNSFKENNLTSSITAHSPYSVSPSLLHEIGNLDNNNRLSIHHLETEDERHLLKNKTGKLAQLFETLGIAIDTLPESISPTQYLAQYLNADTPILFVHNTVAEKEDFEKITEFFEAPFLSICPSSNLYLHNIIPSINKLKESKIPITIGTDSLSSTTTLSILFELQILTQNFPHIPFTDWLSYATLNGAKALGIENRFGSFEIGKKPGINLIEHFDFSAMQLLSESTVKKLI